MPPDKRPHMKAITYQQANVCSICWENGGCRISFQSCPPDFFLPPQLLCEEQRFALYTSMSSKISTSLWSLSWQRAHRFVSSIFSRPGDTLKGCFSSFHGCETPLWKIRHGASNKPPDDAEPDSLLFSVNNPVPQPGTGEKRKKGVGML